jgi:16S rRNA (uracil1498-N3)-methyltransferase
MIRLFLPPDKLTSKEIIIDGENARYLSSVLRVKPGELLTILDGLGNRYMCRISSIHRKEVRAEKIAQEAYSTESPVEIILAQGLPKGDKMDLIIQKTTELGVKKIIPLITERSQVRHTDKIERWRKIALSASQQSGRERIPDITHTMGFKEFLERPKTGHGIILSEEDGEQNLKKILINLQDSKEITLIVGPEGGFSKDEVKTAVQKGFLSASLGPRILRTETAPIAAISIIQYELGDMG